MKKVFGLIVLFFLLGVNITFAQGASINASDLLARVDVYFSPRTGSFEEGTTFDVPIYVNTRGRSINSVEIRVNFDSSRLSIIRPAGGTSIIGIWVEPPQYNNTRGTASYVGVIPGGITTESGLIAHITFEAKRTGLANLSF